MDLFHFDLARTVSDSDPVLTDWSLTEILNYVVEALF